MKLIECGADVNRADLLGHTAVFYACNSAELRNVILMLVHNGAQLAHRDQDGNTIMHQAAQTVPEMLRFLIDLEESLARCANVHGQTPFHLLCLCPPNQGTDAIHVLIDPAFSLDVNQQDENGDTVLHLLCRSVLQHSMQSCNQLIA